MAAFQNIVTSHLSVIFFKYLKPGHVFMPRIVYFYLLIITVHLSLLLFSIYFFSVENHSSKCRFAPWVTEHQHWHTLDGKMSYTFHKNATFKIVNTVDHSFKKVVCHSSEERSDKQIMFITHVTTGW